MTMSRAEYEALCLDEDATGANGDLTHDQRITRSANRQLDWTYEYLCSELGDAAKFSQEAWNAIYRCVGATSVLIHDTTADREREFYFEQLRQALEEVENKHEAAMSRLKGDLAYAECLLAAAKRGNEKEAVR